MHFVCKSYANEKRVTRVESCNSLIFRWAQLGLNQRPPDYESGATNQLSYGPETECKNSKIP